MDVFSRTFLPAAAEAGLAIPTVGRHLPIFRRCVAQGDAATLVARCLRPDRPLRGEFMLLLTERALVVTRETRLLRRVRLHLNAELRHLHNVTWNPDPRLPAVELAATAVDGVRERFLIRAGHPKQVWHLDALFAHAFRPRTLTDRTAPAAPAKPAAPARAAARTGWREPAPAGRGRPLVAPA